MTNIHSLNAAHTVSEKCGMLICILPLSMQFISPSFSTFNFSSELRREKLLFRLSLSSQQGWGEKVCKQRGGGWLLQDVWPQGHTGHVGICRTVNQTDNKEEWTCDQPFSTTQQQLMPFKTTTSQLRFTKKWSTFVFYSLSTMCPYSGLWSLFRMGMSSTNTWLSLLNKYLLP